MNATTRRGQIENVVLAAIGMANQMRPRDQQIEVGPAAPIYGPGSPLDSLGLVALLIDVEDMLRDLDVEVTLNDERAVSQSRSPFRNVRALVDYIEATAGVGA